ncbi:unnamed protein product, partial [Cuscuta epithymum]
MCFNMQNQHVEILDSSSLQIDFEHKYSETPLVLRDMFVQFLSERGLDNNGKVFREPSINCLQMAWRELKNEHNNGLWSMRHMETYNGQGTKALDCGIKKEDAKLLNALRKKYCATL